MGRHITDRGREAEVIPLSGVAGCATSPAATVALVFVLQEGLQLPTGYKVSSIIPKIGSIVKNKTYYTLIY